MRTLPTGTEQPQSMHLGPASCKLGCNLAGHSPKPPARLQTPNASVSKLEQLTPIAWYQGFQGQAQSQTSFNLPFSATCYGFYQSTVWVSNKVICEVDQLLQPRAKSLCSAFLASYSPVPCICHSAPRNLQLSQSSRQIKSKT